MFRFALLGLLCSLAASSTIPAGSTYTSSGSHSSPVGSASYNVEIVIADLGALNDLIDNVKATDTPTADTLKPIIQQINTEQLTEEQLAAKKEEAVQAITNFKNVIDQLKAKATEITERYAGQTGPEAEKVKEAAEAIKTATTAISSNLEGQIAGIQAATTQDQLKEALNAEHLYQSMVGVENFINTSETALNNISLPAEEVKEKLDSDLEKLKESVEAAEKTLADKTKELEDLKAQITSYATAERVQELKDQIKSIIDGLKTKLEEAKGEANALISELPKTLESDVQEAIDNVKNAAQNVLTKIQSASESLTNFKNKVASATSANDLKSKLSTVISNLKTTLTNTLKSTLRLINGIIDSVQQLIANAVDSASQFLGGLVDGVQGYVSELTGQISTP